MTLTKASDAELWCFLWSAPWINRWANNREAGDLIRYRAHYDVTLMVSGLKNSHPSFRWSHCNLRSSWNKSPTVPNGCDKVIGWKWSNMADRWPVYMITSGRRNIFHVTSPLIVNQPDTKFAGGLGRSKGVIVIHSHQNNHTFQSNSCRGVPKVGSP